MEDRGELICCLLRAYEQSQAVNRSWTVQFSRIEQEKLVSKNAERRETAARVIQRSWRGSKKREIKHQAEVLEQKSRMLNTQLSQVSVQNGYLMIKANYAEVLQALGDVAKSFLDPANDY